jgi:hypothetical protein
MLTMALSGRVLTDWFGHGTILAFSSRFTEQVWPGDTLTATATGPLTATTISTSRS